MTDETGFLIDGKRYELPDMGTFTVKESRVFFKETGLVPEVVRMRLADESLTYMDLLENVGFLPALATIAYQRENPGASDVEAVIGDTPRDDLFMGLISQAEDEESPPSEGVTITPPDRSQTGLSESTPSTVSESSISGRSSTSSSEKQDDVSESTGTSESDMWPMLGRERLAT